MKLSDVITPGDKIDIKMAHESRVEENGGQMANVFQSSVCDYISDMEIEIAMPTQGGRMVLFQVGANCEFVFYTRKGMYNCSGVVKSRYRKDNLYLLAILISSPPRKFQRREFFRIDYLSEIKYYEINERIAGLRTTEQLFAEIQKVDYQTETRQGVLQDISGGGVRFNTTVQHQKNDFILLMIRLTNDRMDENFYLVCQIVGCERHPSLDNTFSCRAKFIFKDLKDREKIVKFVFEEERRIRRKEIG